MIVVEKSVVMEWQSESAEFYIKLASGLVLVMILAKWSFLLRGKRARLPPGPLPLSIIRNIRWLGEHPHRALQAFSLKYGPLMSLRLGSGLILVVSSGEMAKEFLKTHDLLFASRAPTTGSWILSYNFSDLALAPYGPSWRHLRKLCVSQLLSSRRIESFRFIREEEVSAMIRSIITLDGPINISETVSTLATDIICRMAFGRKYSALNVNGSFGISSLVMESSRLSCSFDIGDYIPWLAWMDLQGVNRRLKELHRKQDDLLEKLLEEHVSQNSHKAVRCLVDVLFETAANKSLEFEITRENIKGVVYDIIIGGTDTVSTTMEWAMSEVLRSPLVLKKLQDELESVVGMERMVRESDLPRLVYLRAVVKETLRLHVPAPLALPHISVEDCTVLGYQIPKGTRLLLNLWAIGRNPKSWGEDAEIFKPERFVETGSLATKDFGFNWIPFGAGRRGCAGAELGILVVELAIAQLLHCFNWRLPDDINGQELDMKEEFGFTVRRVNELLAFPTPRLTVL